MKTLHVKLALVAFLIVACGDGDGPAPTAQQHPTLGACTKSYFGSDGAAVAWHCTELRNIADEDWASLSAPGKYCDDYSSAAASTFVEDGTCAAKPNRGKCVVKSRTGMTTTDWFYTCADTSFTDCKKTPSVLEAACEGQGGTYIPPDETG